MAALYKINYKSDFVLTINSDAGWAVPFCIKFWTGMPLNGYFAGFDGENYVNCRVGETPTQLLVMFDDHHMPIGELKMQIAYHTTIEEFPDRKFDEVTNPTNVTVEIDGTEYQVMLDFTGETGAEIDFSMPSSGVMSVNGKIGYVTLNAEDVGAQPTIEDLATIRSGAAEGATAVQPAEMTAALATKQDVINDLPTIRSGAAAGATAVQPATLQEGLAGKQDTISDLSTIRSGAAAGATAVQPAALQEGLAGKQDTISDLATIRSGAAAGATAVQPAALTPIENDIDAIEGKIPSAASASNQLADKAFVNSALSGKADTSDIPTALSQLSQDSTHRVVTDAEKSTWNGKQNAISDLSTIRSGAAEGATAVQPAEMTAALATKQDVINDLPTIRSGAAAGATAVQPATLQEGLAGKQDTISDLATIRSGAAAGATAVQPATLQEGLAGKQDTISDLATIRSGAAAGATAVQPAALTPIENDIDAIEGKIPSAASASNQLADKAFVNSALSSKADAADIPTALSQLSQDSTHRVVTDAEKSTWNGKQNAIDDLATIRSGAAAGATAVQPAALQEGLAGKQDTISDLSTIRSGAAAGATAVQPAAMNTALAEKQDTLTFDNAPTANSNNPVKSSGIKTALDAKQSTISTVNVTVDNNTGTPSGSASVSGSTLSLSFQNLKGATGATGATGPQGPQGERGLPGESGVTGDVSGFTVIQTIDPSATYGATDIAGAATVQATKAELTELEGDVYSATSMPKYIGISSDDYEQHSFTLAGSKKWNYANGRHIIIPCVDGDVFHLTSVSDGDGNFYGWLSSYSTPAANATTPYVTGTDRIWVNDSDSPVTLTAPTGAVYLCLVTINGSGEKTTWTGNKEVVVTIKEMLNNVDTSPTEGSSNFVTSGGVYAHQPVTSKFVAYDTSLMTKTTYTLAGSKKWNYADGNHIVIECSAGDKFHIKSSTTGNTGNFYGWLASYSTPTAGSTVPYVSGYNRTWFSDSDTLTTITAPAGAAYLCLITTDGDGHTTKWTGKHEIGGFALNEVISELAQTSYVDGQIAEVEKKITTSWAPSSYIPINETYENYMAINGGQGGTVYGDYFVQGFDYASSSKFIRIYSLTTKTLVQQVNLPELGNARTHCNTMSFGNKYDSGDDFPLLYICSGYTDTTSASTSEVYAIRIEGSNGNYTTSLVQTITLDFNSWTEAVVDPINNRLWINGSSIATYICVALPDTSSSAVTIDNNTAIIDKFDRPSILLGVSTKSSGQGRFFHNNRVYWVSGMPQNTSEGVDSVYLVVDNCMTHCTETVVSLKNFGLVGTSGNTYEPESCFIWQGNMYVAYPNFIAKLIQ